MEEALINLLLSSAGVTALVSNRIELGRSTQDEQVPRIVLQLISTVKPYMMVGSSNYTASRVQIDVYANRYLEAKQISRAVSKALSGYWGGIFQAIFIQSERDLTAADAGEVNQLFRTSIDITIHHKEL